MGVDAEEVLGFWLAGDSRQLYRDKWFASGAQQTAVDEEVTRRFGDTVDAALRGELQHWRRDGRGTRALILVLDQFSRHVFRRRGAPDDDETRRLADRTARALTDELLTESDWDAQLSVAEFVFAVMPMRHTGDGDAYRRLLALVERREGALGDEAALLDKFRRQTQRRLHHMEDRGRADEAGGILERLPFSADESAMALEPLVQTVRSFLLRQTAYLTGPSPAFISLSGGVDSMVLCKILCYLRDSYPEASMLSAVVAVHVDYSNRPESAAEAIYVQQWCASLRVECIVRVIAEVRRGVTARDEYERVARDLRYDTYRQALAAHSTEHPLGVMFGHHQGDLQENVISNVMRGCSPLLLAGMAESSSAHGVLVWRPLLAHSKDLIFNYAHKYGVPYFRDTTPSWSTRGKLRSLLLPLLADMYGAGFLQNLSSLAAASDSTRQLVDESLYQPFLASVERTPAGLRVGVRRWAQQPQCFWAEALKRLMHSLGMPLVRDRSVANFADLIRRRSLSAAEPVVWLELRKGFYTLLQAGELVIFHEGALRSTRPACALSVDALPMEQQLQGWSVRVSQVSLDSVAEPEYTLPSDALSAVLSGAFYYLIRLRRHTTCLCIDGSDAVAEFICSGKAKKKAEADAALKTVFRGLDARLRASLPLLVEARSQSSLEARSEEVQLLLQYTYKGSDVHT